MKERLLQRKQVSQTRDGSVKNSTDLRLASQGSLNSSINSQERMSSVASQGVTSQGSKRSQTEKLPKKPVFIDEIFSIQSLKNPKMLEFYSEKFAAQKH